MKKMMTLLIPILLGGLLVGTTTLAPAQLSDDSFSSLPVASLSVANTTTTQSSDVPSATSSPAAAPAVSPPAISAQTLSRTTVGAPARTVASRGGSTLSSYSPSGNVSGASAVIATAKQYLGVRYVWGGTSPSGFDCSGFTQYVFARHGISLPRVSGDQYSAGNPVSFDNLQAGDLVFFALNGNGISHMGIYIGGGQFINASTSKGVTVYTLGSYWKSHYVGARRVL